jgi:transcription initiation factor TFIIIB Brf1 subunit/transcription initiation factor TFIIB
LNDKKKNGKELTACTHKNIKQERGYFVCQDCGIILEDNVAFETSTTSNYFSDSRLEYERKIRNSNSRATQDPKTKKRYDQINTLNIWFRDYQSNFSEQKKTIDLLKGYGIGLNIDSVKYREIKAKYLQYNKHHRQTYENMVIIFLAIIWMEIKETTNVRIEEFIKRTRELGHKINKKMLSNAMEKVKRTERRLKIAESASNLEEQIKNKIKILFQKDLNNIIFKDVKQHLSNKTEYNKLKLDMQLKANKILNKITYEQIQSSNHKAFTAGLIYYIGQSLENRKIITQSIVERTSRFSSTTIRKKYNVLKKILGDPQELDL